MKIVLTFIAIFTSILTIGQVNTCAGFEWTKQSNGKKAESIIDIALDSQQNMYLLGSMSDTIKLGNITVNPTSSYNFFITKMDKKGNYIWATKAYSGVILECSSIAIDLEGNTFISGRYYGLANFGNIILTAKGNQFEVFVAKLDSNGNYLWAINSNSYDKSNIHANSITTDNKGNCYLSGDFGGTVTFGKTKVTYFGGLFYDGFVAKINGNGNFVWVATLGGDDYDIVRSITSDSIGNCYITGDFSDTAKFGKNNLIGIGRGVYIAKLDSGGNFVWANNIGSKSYTTAKAIILGKNGNTYISGIFKDTATFGNNIVVSKNYSFYTSKLDVMGNFIWVSVAENLGAIGDLFSISLDSNENIYSIGKLNAKIKFGNFTLTPDGSDNFLSKMNSNGNYIWASKLQDDASSLTLATDKSGDCYVAGYFDGTKTFGEKILVSTGTRDFFISKIIEGKLNLEKFSVINNTCGKTIQLNPNASFYTTMNWTPNYEISDPNILNPLFSNITTTTYELRISDGCDQSVSEKVTITVNPYTIDLGENKNIVCGKTYPLIAKISDSIPNVFYKWNNAVDLNNSNIYNPIANPIETKIFKVTATTSKGCTSTDSVEIIVKPYSVDIGQDLSVNCGNYTQLNAELNDTVPNINYSWTPTTGLNNFKIENPTIKPIETTQYKVTATTVKGCFAADSINITLNNPYPPTVKIISNTGSFYLCDGGIQLSVFGFDSNIWSNGSTDAFIIVSKPGWYSVVSKDEDGCAGTDSVEIKTYAQINAPFGTILCPGQTNQKIKLVAASGMDGYEWNTGEKTQSIEVSTSGIYSVSVNKDNCTYTTKKEVTKSSGQANADFNYSAKELTVYFNDLSASTNSIKWDFGDGSYSTESNPIHQYSETGNYDVKISITDYCGNNAEHSKTIFVSGQISSVSKLENNIILVYPNPANETITFDMSKMATSNHLLIFDMNGKQIISKNIETSITSIHISNLSEGIYFYKILGNEQIHSGKFLVLNK